MLVITLTYLNRELLRIGLVIWKCLLIGTTDCNLPTISTKGSMLLYPAVNFKMVQAGHVDTPAIMPPISNETSSIQQGYNLKEIGGSALPHDDDGVTGKTASSYINISTNALTTQSFNKNGLSSIASPIPNLNAVGHIQEAILTNPPRGGTMTAPQNQTLVQDRKMINIPDIGNFLANGQQLPQLYAARNSHNGTFANSEGTVKPDSMVTIQPNQAVEPRKQYDPICDSVEPGKHHVNTNPPDQKLELLSKLENNGVGSEESNKVQEQDKSAQENGPLENSDGDGKADESKKNKDAKGNRAFKFALVEFVKDLLKPAWKEGQMSKDAYKNIVKKVVDKVTGTMQSASIPTTQEKLNNTCRFQNQS
ncbi:hypothetical protein H0E87_014064 [Populus deltoides]|uniref:SFR19-like C-terminal domain-containing protein n=1 Tax=Populus deltoides TaxID=3696 RepID=A0A8T2YC69_POPDE|nr:hypothetical protein H0E87_014064 [Populus deltoides]